jgi:hypothetical protein
MKSMSVWSKALLILILAASIPTLSATPPLSTPPRGNAYGHRLHDGVLVTLVYLDDGSRIIDLSDGRPRREYVLEATEDLVNWQAIAILRVTTQGTATFVDTAPLPHCFYRVKRVR